MVVGASRWDSIQPILWKLHWLPVSKRILFKLLLIVYKSLSGLAPAYIDDLLRPYIPTRTLRSSTLRLLAVPSEASSCSGYGDPAFSIAAPREWNKLPESVRKAQSVESFKNQLKTLQLINPVHILIPIPVHIFNPALFLYIYNISTVCLSVFLL